MLEAKALAERVVDDLGRGRGERPALAADRVAGAAPSDLVVCVHINICLWAATTTAATTADEKNEQDCGRERAACVCVCVRETNQR